VELLCVPAAFFTRQSGSDKVFRQPPRPNRCVVLRQLASRHIFAARLEVSLVALYQPQLLLLPS
jgi:hypothetical protein